MSILMTEVPTGHEKKQDVFSNPKKKSMRVWAMTVMKDTYPKRKFKLLKNLEDLKYPDFRIYPEI